MTCRGRKQAEIAILILTLNQKEKTLTCLSSLREVQEPPFNIVLWDNGSNDGTCEEVKERFPEVLVHQSDVNLGVAGGRNHTAALAIKEYKSDFLLFLDNDTVVKPDFLEPLYRPFGSDKKLAQTSGKIMFLKDPKRINIAGGAEIKLWIGSTQPVGYREIDRGQYDKVQDSIPNGCLMMVKTDVFEKLGGFDTRFHPYGYEDLDFSLRVKKSRYNGLYIPQSVIYHDPTQTFEGGEYTEKYATHKVQTYLMFMNKHATVGQKAAFILIGLPYLFLRALFREAKRGNLRTVRGLLRGLLKKKGT